MEASEPSITCFGREPVLAVLAEAVEAAVPGRFTGVLLDGKPGIGKSCVLAAAAQAERARGRHVATAQARELERTRPFGLVSAALPRGHSANDAGPRQIAALLAGAPDGPTVTSDPGLQHQVVDQFIDLIEAEALTRSIVLILDDLHWADPSSLLVLGTLGRRLGHLPITLIGALRTGPGPPDVERFRSAFGLAGGRSVTLGALDETSVRAMVTELTGALPGAGLWAEVESAAGNPLFVRELVSAFEAEGILTIDAGVADVPRTQLPRSLQQAILQRVRFLPESALQVLRLASVLGTGFPVGDLAEVTDRSVVQITPDLDVLFATGALVDDGEVMRFGHDLVRQAIYREVPRSVRIGLHREVAVRLATAGADPLVVAEHYRRSASPGDREAVQWLTRASRRSAHLAPVTSADLLSQAIDLLEPADVDERARLGVERAGRLLWAGSIRDAEVVCRALRFTGDTAVRGQARALLGRCLLADGRMDEAARELEDADRVPDLPAELRVTILTSASTAHLFAGRMRCAVSAALRAQALAQTRVDPTTRSMVFKARATAELFQGNLGPALELVDQAVTDADSSVGRQGHRDVHHLVRGHALIELDRLEEAHHSLEQGMRLCEELGLRWSLGAYQLMIAVAHHTAGDWTTALGAVEAGEELSAETGESYNVIAGHCIRGLIAWHRNDATTAASCVSAAQTEIARAGPRFRHHWASWLASLQLEAAGNLEEAHACLTGAWRALASAEMAIEYGAIGPDLIRMAMRVGDSDTAAEVVAAVTGVAGRNDVASLTGAADRCRGLASGDPKALERAAAAYAQSPRRLERAATSEEAGGLWARHGDRGRAGDLLTDALAMFEDLGADRDAARTTAQLRELGVRRRARAPHRTAVSGWQSLTPAELRVVDLVVEGLTNPQIGRRLFVSRRTVQTHLAHVFQKLQVASRSELAALAARRDVGRGISHGCSASP